MKLRPALCVKVTPADAHNALDIDLGVETDTDRCAQLQIASLGRLSPANNSLDNILERPGPTRTGKLPWLGEWRSAIGAGSPTESSRGLCR